MVIDAGHINVESDLAPSDIVQEIKSKKPSDYTSEDYVRFRSLMYDKFAVHLTQTKIVVGESVQTCLDQVRNPKEENNYLHLIDRIDMSFQLEMCIVQNLPDLSNFKISGHLPLLSVNFSDTKYRSIMQIPHLIEATGLLNHDQSDDISNQQNEPENVQPGDMHDNSNISKLMHTRLWKSSEEYVVESDSDDDSSDQLGSTTAATTTVSVSSSGDNKKSNVNKRIFELNFQMDKVSANILESRGSGKESLLCDLVLQHLSVDYCLRPFDMSVDVSLKSLSVADRMKHGNEFKYLITSDQDVLQPDSNLTADSNIDAKDLVNVQYIRVNRSSPEYYEKYKGMDQTATVALSTLNFIITRSSVLTLHNFVLNTFVNDQQQYPVDEKRKTSTSNDSPETQRSQWLYKQRELQQQQQQQQSIHVTLLLDSVNLILNNDGVRLATAELSHGDMTTVIANGTTKVTAKFANLTLSDDLTEHHPGEGASISSSEQLLTIQGEELIDFRYETYLAEHSETYPGYDQSIFVRMGSAQFTLLEEPVHQLLSFLNKFAAMKSVYDRARQAALESAQQLQQSTAKTHFDIVIQTPVVMFPQMHQHPNDTVVAHLGEIWMSNTFENQDGGCLNAIKAGIRSISLTSKYYHPTRVSDRLELQTLPIVDKIDIDFDIKCIHEPTNKPRPDIDIVGTISDIRMHLTDRQYTFLIDAANMFSRVFSESPDAQVDMVMSPPPQTNEKMIQALQKSDQPSPKTEHTHTDQPRIRMILSSKTIGLDLYQPGQSSAVIDLSRVALNQSSLQLNMRKDDTMRIDLKVTSMTVDDTRPNIKSKFKDIMPSAENGHHFQMQMDVSAPDPIRHAIAMITLTEPKIVLSLDHTFMLYRFFMTPFGPRSTGKSPTVSRQKDQSQKQQEQQQQQGMDISYRVNIVKPEFILIANPDNEDSEAVVLSADEFIFSQQAVMSLAVRQIGMFLCRMDMRQNSTLRFIQPFDVTLSMNNNSTARASGNPNTELAVDVESLVLRLSYRDAMLVTDIFNKAYELYISSLDKNDLESASSPQQHQTGLEMESFVSSMEQRLMHESVSTFCMDFMTWILIQVLATSFIPRTSDRFD